MRALEDREVLPDILRRHGTHSLAYSTLQPRMLYWGDRDVGFAAYRKNVGRYTFLGDPLCAPAALESFLENTVAAFPGALFMQIHLPAAACLRRMGYRITPVGVENEIDPGDFSLAGKRRADLRHYRNKAQKGGVAVREVLDSKTQRARLRPVSEAWLPMKSWISRELEFLARPFAAEPEPGVRVFTGEIAGRPVAFVVLDPMYTRGVATGYTVSILRHEPDAPEGTVDYIVLHVIEALRREGIPLLSLGVSPFHRLEALGTTYGRGSLPAYLLYLGLRRWGNPVYHFRGLSFHKSRYRARETPVFTAVSGRFGLWSLYASARACRMV